KFRRQSGVTSEEGARTQVYLATAQEAKGISGKYWDNLQPKDSSKNSYDQESAQKLWEVSCQLCGISDFFNPEL
ncbi:MAG: short-chain dehydrogenase, partial [Saprospiraceae bacterium]|nr:short-chain dehydrogenase [Saprospiraceae bacterium]